MKRICQQGFALKSSFLKIGSESLRMVYAVQYTLALRSMAFAF